MSFCRFKLIILILRHPCCIPQSLIPTVLFSRLLPVLRGELQVFWHRTVALVDVQCVIFMLRVASQLCSINITLSFSLMHCTGYYYY